MDLPRAQSAGPSSSSRKRPADQLSERDNPQAKRTEVELGRQQEQSPSCVPGLPELSLQVKWISSSGKTRINELSLEEVSSHSGNGHPKLRGLHKRLWQRAFGGDGSSSSNAVSLSPDQYLKFGTSNECLNFPIDIVSTEFKLLAMHEGWQYCLHETGGLGRQNSQETGPPRMHVTIIEFESIARVIGHLGIRLQMVAYPVVAVSRAFLDDAVARMREDPEFKGILS